MRKKIFTSLYILILVTFASSFNISGITGRMDEFVGLPPIMGLETSELLQTDWWTAFEVPDLEDFLMIHDNPEEIDGKIGDGEQDMAPAHYGTKPDHSAAAEDGTKGENGNKEKTEEEKNHPNNQASSESTKPTVQEIPDDGKEKRGLKRRRSV